METVKLVVRPSKTSWGKLSLKVHKNETGSIRDLITANFKDGDVVELVLIPEESAFRRSVK